MPADDRDLINTWSREFCEALSDRDLLRQDAVDVWFNAFARYPDLDQVQRMDAAGIERLAEAARTFLEDPSITGEPMRVAVERTLSHWR